MSLRLFVAVFLLGVSIGTRSEDNHHTLWTVKGNHNTDLPGFFGPIIT